MSDSDRLLETIDRIKLLSTGKLMEDCESIDALRAEVERLTRERDEIAAGNEAVHAVLDAAWGLTGDGVSAETLLERVPKLVAERDGALTAKAEEGLAYRLSLDAARAEAARLMEAGDVLLEHVRHLEDCHHGKQRSEMGDAYEDCSAGCVVGVAVDKFVSTRAALAETRETK